MTAGPSHAARLVRDWRVALGIGFACMLLMAWLLSYSRAEKNAFDFHYFYEQARVEAAHRQPAATGDAATQPVNHLPFYLPVVSLGLAPLGYLSQKAAAAVWASLQTIALAMCAWQLHRLIGVVLRARSSRDDVRESNQLATTALVLLLLPVIFEALRFNQLSLFVLAILLAALNFASRGTMPAAGVTIMLATILKLLPGIFLFWLAMKRSIGGLIGAVAMFLLVAVAVPMLAWGPGETIARHSAWLRENFTAGGGAELEVPASREHFRDHRNQSLAAVFTRLLERGHPDNLGLLPFGADRATVRAIALGAALLIAAWVCWTLRGRTSTMRPEDFAVDFAISLLAMSVLSPLVRTYYLVWCAPALAVFVAWAVSAARGRRWIGICGLSIWFLMMAAWMSPVARSLGAQLWGQVLTIALLSCCVERPPRLSRRERSRPRSADGPTRTPTGPTSPETSTDTPHSVNPTG